MKNNICIQNPIKNICIDPEFILTGLKPRNMLVCILAWSSVIETPYANEKMPSVSG